MAEDILYELLADPKTRQQFALLPETSRDAFSWRANWLAKAHDHQILPAGDWWTIWLLLAGRGAGKTRTAAEQIAWWAWTEPNTRWLVAAPTSADVRSTCFEGDSGLLSIIPPSLIAEYNKALHELKLINGSLIKGIPASEPERFRGPQFHGAWCCAPGTMILMADGSQKPIEAVQIGEQVMTRHGARKVLQSCISGNPNELVTMDCGATSLTVTTDHPILVGDQWIPAGDIKKGDLVWVTQEPKENTRTATFIDSILGKYQKGGLFITRMKTSQTTTPQTLSPCRSQSIKDFTPKADREATNRNKPLSKLLNLFAPLSMASALSVAKSLFQGLQTRLESFVPSFVPINGVATGSNLNSAIALSATQNTLLLKDSSDIAVNSATLSPKSEPIGLKQMAVLHAERLPNSLTYNLTVEGEHEFIANGIVVHNCDELAAWDYLQDAWDQIMFGVRLGKRTRILCTTTPKPKDLIIELVGREGDDVFLTTASTYSNIENLAPSFQKQILQYEGTKLGRQEIYAEIIDPEESGIVKREMIKLWPVDKPFPKFEYILQSYDCATSEKTQNDPTASSTWGVFKPTDGPMSAMLIDCWQDRLQYPDLRPKVQDEYEVVFGEGKDRKRVDLILIEDKSAGISLIQDLQRAHLPVRAYNPGSADKLQRLNIVSSLFARGRVWMPESSQRPGYVKDWVEPLLSQLCSFPDTTHDDFVDSTTQALRYLRDAGFIDIDGPAPEAYDEDDLIDAGGKRRENPYAA